MADQIERLQRALTDRYVFEREIGQGGMATVYLAHDVRHERKVAVKVLRSDIAATLGAERFLREVHIAASLTHPHILALHDSGEADGFLYYVMPYIEGESLRERVAREGELPVPDAVRIIRDVTDALAYAHSRNVVHRDIKPDNIMLSGRHALVTDFGVAKAVSEATGRDMVTTVGVALGTPSYMAPEQAAADPHVDHRADLYAVGVVAYELLAGAPPFTGTTQQQILAAHLAEQPRPLRERRATLPPALEQFVMKCLEKRPSDRWQNADEMVHVLEGLGTPSLGVTPAGTTPVTSVARPARSYRGYVLTGVTVAVAVMGILGWAALRDTGPRIEITNTRQITRGLELELDPVISPDGREVAYVVWSGNRRAIHVLDLEGGRPIELTSDSLAGTPTPRWSSDGRSVVFGTSAGTVTVPRFGGPSTPLVTALVFDVHNDAVLYRRGRDSLYIRDGDGDRLIRAADYPYSGTLSPDGRRVAYVTGSVDYVMMGGTFGNVAASTIWVLDVDGGEPVAVTTDGSLNASPAWLPDGRGLLFISDRDGARDIYHVRLSSSGAAEGDPVRLTTGLEPHSVSLSADGTRAVFSRFIFRRNIREVPLPSSGIVSLDDGRPLTSGNQIVESHGISPDGRWLAYDANLEGNQDVFVVSTDGGEPRRLTTDAADDFNPDWSPDGREIAFHSARFGSRDIFVMDADGNNTRRVTEQPGHEYHAAFSPDGLSLAYSYSLTADEWALWVISRDAPGEAWGEPRRVSPGSNTWGARWSPDGRSLVGHTPNSLVVVSVDGTERTVFTSTEAVRGPAWPEFSADGQRIHFFAADAAGLSGLYSVPVAGGEPQLAVRFPDQSKPVWPIMTMGNGVVYLSVAEHESDVYAMDLVIR